MREVPPGDAVRHALALAAALAAGAGGRVAAADPSRDEPLAQHTLVEEAPVAAQLRVERLPVRLRMRPRAPAKVAQTPDAGADADAGASTEPGTAAPPVNPYAESSLTSFTPLPKSKRDLAERVILKVRAGVELDGAPGSGDPLRGGAPLPDQFAGSRPWLVGDAVVGVRDMLLPSLGGYFLSSFQLDASDALATRSALVRPVDANDQRIAIKAGYAEWGRDDRRPDQKLWLRGGRQYRLDGGALFAYFDGATIGWHDKGWNASAFAGQRVALYVETPRGLTYGATLAVDLQRLKDIPVRLAADVMGLSIDAVDPAGQAVTSSRLLVALSGHYERSKATKLDVRTRFVDGGAGALLGRAGARVRHVVSKQWLVIGDLEYRAGGDLAYDLAAPSAVDVVDISRRLGVGLVAPIDAVTVGARADWRDKDKEVLAFVRLEQPLDADAQTNHDHRGWAEGGVAFAGAPFAASTGRLRGLWGTAQYKLRSYGRDDARNDQMGSAFGDTSTSGLDRLHELSADATIRSARGARRWRLSSGLFYRVYDLRSPYVEISNEGRAGGRADFHIWLAKDVRAELAGGVAQAAPIVARELGTLTAVRAALEARW